MPRTAGTKLAIFADDTSIMARDKKDYKFVWNTHEREESRNKLQVNIEEEDI